MASTRRIDRSRGDAGQISPPMKHQKVPNCVAHYTQDGFMFDQHGKLLEAFLTTEQKKKLDVHGDKPKAPNPNAAADKEGEKESNPSVPKTRLEQRREHEMQKADNGDVNLAAWLTGDEKYPEYRVKNTVRARYSVVFGNVADLARFLVMEQRLVPIEDVREDLRVQIVPPQDQE